MSWELSSKALFVGLIGVSVRYRPIQSFFQLPYPRRLRDAFARRNPRVFRWGQEKIANGSKA